MPTPRPAHLAALPAAPEESSRTEPTSGVWQVSKGAPVDTYALHDAKNLLGAMFANIDWLRQTHEGAQSSSASDAARAAEALEAISDLTQACRQLESLLAEGLVARQVPLGPITLKKSRCSVAGLVSSAVRRVGKRAILADLQIDVTGTPDLMAVLDPELSGRVLDNLLDNALRVSPGGTKISVHFGDCSGELVISITDQGPGVPESDRERIFEMFGTSPTLPGTRGTAGIGLAFCRKVAEAHGGRVILDDRPKGASFVVTFPIFG